MKHAAHRKTSPTPGPIQPPDLFREVADRLGFSPPNLPPGPPRIPPVPEPPPGTWYPEIEGEVPPEEPGGILPNEGPRPTPMDESNPQERETWRSVEPGPPHESTPDSVAYYRPWHVGGNEHWGIYFRKRQMNEYIERIQNLFRWYDMRDVVIEQVYWHEMEHFEQEKAATALEDLLGEILYPTWLSERYGIPVQLENQETGGTEPVDMIEEALATAREIEWARRHKARLPAAYSEFIAWDSRSAPIGYRNFYLCLGDWERQQARAAFLESVGSVAKSSPRQRLTGGTADRLFGIRTGKPGKVPIRWIND